MNTKTRYAVLMNPATVARLMRRSIAFSNFARNPMALCAFPVFAYGRVVTIRKDSWKHSIDLLKALGR